MVCEGERGRCRGSVETDGHLMDKKKNKSTSRSLEDALHERLDQARASASKEGLSDYLPYRQIILKTHHSATGKTKHYQGSLSPQGLERGAELQTPYQLTIAQIPPDKGYYLLYLDEEGNEITDTYHESLEAALEQAKWEFNVEPHEWENLELFDREDQHSNKVLL